MSAKVVAGIRAREAARKAPPVVVEKPKKAKAEKVETASPLVDLTPVEPV